MEQALPPYLNQATSLSAEVEPFVPRSDFAGLMAEHMPSQGPLPHYLTSCYPFVQDPNGNNIHIDQLDYHNYYKDARGYGSSTAAQNPHFQIQHHSRYINHGAQHHAGNMPRPTGQSTPMHAYHPNTHQFPYAGFSQVQYRPQYMPPSLSRDYSRSPSARRSNNGRRHNNREENNSRKNQRSVGIQMEVSKVDAKDSETAQEMIDCALQTDFPSDIASKTLVEKPSPLKKMTRSARRRRANLAIDRNASCESSDNNGDEADVDSDSGYYSPKHRLSRRNQSALISSGAPNLHDDKPDAGYQRSESHQRLMYLQGPPPGHPNALYHLHPNHFLAGPPAPGQMMRLPTPTTPPMIMTPPPHMNVTHQMAMTNFKSRSSWEQEVLKAHNVAPIRPPAFVPRNLAPHPESGSRQKNWNFPRFQGPRQPSHNQQNNVRHRKEHGLLRVNPDTAPSNLVLQNPPPLTDDDFPDLQSASASAGQGDYNSPVFSYSAALQSKPRPMDRNLSEDSPVRNLIEGDDSGPNRGSRRRRKKTERAAKAAAEEYAEITEEQENLKKKLSSKKGKDKAKSGQLNLGEMLSKLEKTQSQSENDVSPTKKTHLKQSAPVQRSSQYFVPHNPLDSTAPLKKRGKEREVPKVKKPSALKKVILKEREEKKTARIATLTADDLPEYDIPPVAAEFLTKELALEEDEKSVSEGLSASEANRSGNDSPVPTSAAGAVPIPQANLPKIHSRRYREYCSGQVLEKEIDEECIFMLQRLVLFQERVYQKDPVNAKSKRRFVLGIREVTKHLKLNKLRCVLISPNLEKIQAKGGLDDALQQIIQLCKTQNVPYVFALGRRAMGRAVSKLVPVSIIGIFDYSGAEESFKKMLGLVNEAKQKYDDMMALYKEEITEAISTPPTAPPAPTKRFAHMGHSRNPSAASGISFCSVISEPISEMPSDGASWRKIMDVTDEQNAALALPPPAEAAPEEESVASQPDHSEIDPTPDRSPGSDANVDQADLKFDSSFSTVSTLVPQPSDVKVDSKPIDVAVERSLPVSDTEARIESWLASSLQTIESQPRDRKTAKDCVAEQFLAIEEEDGDCSSAGEEASRND